MKLTVSQAAERMGVAASTVRYWITRGWLKAEPVTERMYLIDPKDLRKLKDRPKRGPVKKA